MSTKQETLGIQGLLILFSILMLLAPAHADDQITQPNPLSLGPITFGGLIDTYYTQNLKDYDVLTRDYLTQPSRSREFNVNLAMAEAKFSTDNWRGRLAGQAGTSVDVNYSAEPERGWKYLQDASLGYKLADNLWLDGGIYLSHIGLESFNSRDNWAYTRLLASEFSPYYQEGVKLSYDYSSNLSFQFHLLNGWQNISDFNGRPALGTEAAYTFDGGQSLTWNTFLGKESEGTRFFNDFIAKTPLTDKLEAAAIFDIGNQVRTDDSSDQWYTWAGLLHYKATDKVRFTVRGEQYDDPDQVIVSTASGNKFNVFATSFGVDYEPIQKLLLRAEYRKFYALDPVFRTDRPDDFAKYDDLVVASIGYSF